MPSFDFHVGDRIITTADEDGCPAGEIGTVAATLNFDPNGWDAAYVCHMETDGGEWHPVTELYWRMTDEAEASQRIVAQNEWSATRPEWWMVSTDKCKKYTGTYKRVVYTCEICGRTMTRNIVKSKKGKYVCKQCLSTKSYSTQNNTKAGKPTKLGYTYGFEFECVPKSESDKAVLVSKKWGFIPTSDSSLCGGGVELKSPTISGRSSLRRMFTEAYNSVDFSHNSCGQHINIGNSVWMGEQNIRLMRNCARSLFIPLQTYMKNHPSSVKAICGRNFGSYCALCDNGSQFRHGMWLNLAHDNRVEFRISKFRTPEQYYNLVNMWTEMLENVKNHFISAGGTEAAAQKTGAILVGVFMKYEKMLEKPLDK